MTAVKRAMRDPAVFGGGVLLLVFAIASLVFVLWNGSVRSTDDRLVETARTQIQYSHELAAAALVSPDGAATATGDLASTVAAFTRGHHGLRYGDGQLGLPGVTGTDLEILFDRLEPTFADLVAGAGGIAEPPFAAQDAAVVRTAAADYREQMARIASLLVADAEDHRVVAHQVQLGWVAVGFSIAIMVLMVAAHRRQRFVGVSERAPAPGDLDQLTGLVRRHALREHLIDVIHRRPDFAGFVALVLVDIRPSTGAGRSPSRRARDRVVQEAARRLRSTVRSTDVIARTGSTQFAVVMDRSPRIDDAGRVSAKIAEILDDTILVGNDAIRLSPAIGIALSPLDASTGDELLEKARLALRAATESPGSSHRYYAPDLRPAAAGFHQLAESLGEAIGAGDQLWVAYQPKIRLRDSAVVGFEALARWDHPTLGAVEPEQFIAIAEESDLILELGAWVVDEVCGQLAAWRRAGHPLLPVSVNVSTRQFRHGDLNVVIAAALERHGLGPDLIEVEITEGVLIDEKEEPLSHMQDLRALGVAIAIDDFGTGYSSLSYLKRFPVDTLKIDRSFVAEVAHGPEDAAISTAIIALGHSLGMRIVAEGVETEQQLAMLRGLGCDVAQGFLFSRPLPASKAAHFLRRPTADVSPSAEAS